ncbi:hypothetical protein EBB07_06720 [Paenibacillaceae bacterium]|nr:hypothetical protein EBB07_06720 [Paenibacillaceae bacterium]
MRQRGSSIKLRLLEVPMEATLHQLEQLSYSLVERLAFTELDQLNDYMRERDALFIALQQMTVTPAQKQAHQSTVKRILQMDEVIVGRMKELRAAAELEINKLSNGRVVKNIYEPDAYEQESYFFDQRK